MLRMFAPIHVIFQTAIERLSPVLIFPVLLVGLIGFANTAVAIAADGPNPPSTKKSGDNLDEQLLKGLSGGLTGDLLDGLDEKSTVKKPDGNKGEKSDTKPVAPVKGQKTDNPLDQELLKALREGEDIGESGNPLVRIGQKMRSAEELLGQGKETQQARDLQNKIVADLDVLIKQLKQQQQKQKSAGEGKPGGSQRSGVNQPGGSKSGSGEGNQASSGPARESTTQLRDGKAEAVDMAEMKKLLKYLWGDLPEKDREALLNSSDDRFLPKYELLLEKYFRRLSEQKAKP